MSRSDIDHYAGLEFWGPYDAAMIDRLLGTLDVPTGGHALDVGCGDGALLLRLALEHGMRVTGVDRSEAALTRAAERFAATDAAGAATWRREDAGALTFADDTFDVIAWLGGPHVGDSHAATVQTFARWLKPGGRLLLGQGHWIEPPPADYLAATGLPAEALDDEPTMLAAVTDAGFEVQARIESSRAVWDHFEGTVHANHEAHAARHPDDEAVQAMIASKRRWARAQTRWGRDVMGFALYAATHA